MLGKTWLSLASYRPISKALLLERRQRASVHIFRKSCPVCALPNNTFQLAYLYKSVSANVNLKETVLYGKSSAALSRNPNECGMGTTAKIVWLGTFLDQIPPKDLSDDPQVVEQMVISVQRIGY